VWTRNGTISIPQKYRPFFRVSGKDMDSLERKLHGVPGVHSTEREMVRADIRDVHDTEFLRVNVDIYSQFKVLASKVAALGNYSDHDLFDVEPRLAQKFMHDRGLYPLAPVKVSNGSVKAVGSSWDMDYELPPLTTTVLEITGSNPHRFPKEDEPIRSVRLGSERLDGLGEDDLLEELQAILDGEDPDIIFTVHGDTRTIPQLFARARALGVDLRLGRASQPTSADRKGSSYWSYNRVVYRPPAYYFRGRYHLDRRGFFVHSAGGPWGLFDLARISGVPVQVLSRLSPGTAVSALQMHQASSDGVAVKWKKNDPERFKTARRLLLTDRGGFTFDPRVGLHDRVVELDFASLYPSIMVNFNISPETVDCSCCGKDPDVPRVPECGYHVCTRREGLIPRVISPVLSRRLEFKKRSRESSGEYARRCCQIQEVLKSLLVTSFGYTGYKNARFSRIECYESITAYARELVMRAKEVAENNGFDILHGIVDSLWVRGNGDHQRLSSAIFHRTGVQMSIEGVYDWIVFLPNRSNGSGALTRYYGKFSNGNVKVRGIELRQHSTPELIRSLQRDVLEVLSRCGNADQVRGMVPEAVDMVYRHARRVIDGGCNTDDLVITTRLSRALEDCKVMTVQAAASWQMKREGLPVSPGEKVKYVVTNSSVRDPHRKVSLARNMPGSYDREYYLTLLLRGAESILLPFGVTVGSLRDGLGEGKQTGLERWM